MPHANTPYKFNKSTKQHKLLNNQYTLPQEIVDDLMALKLIKE
jgi:hypothetical protein